MYAFSIILFIAGIAAVWPLGSLIYDYSYLSKIPKQQKLPMWEKALYYFIAIYPIIGYIILPFAGDYFATTNITKTTLQQHLFFYLLSHFVLTVFSVAVIRYLIKKHKAHYIFAVTSSVAGGMFVMGGIVLMMIK